jgi:hypothetical protein
MSCCQYCNLEMIVRKHLLKKYSLKLSNNKGISCNFNLKVTIKLLVDRQ